MKPSERIAKAFHIGPEWSTEEVKQELAEFLEREGIDRLFAIEAAAKDALAAMRGSNCDSMAQDRLARAIG